MKLEIANPFYNNNFANKKIMIIIPHQDDELFLCGTILGALKQVNCKISVVFVTNGDYSNCFVKRKHEAIKALSKYGVEKNSIIFLGYGDQYDTPYGHIYNAPEDLVVVSKSNHVQTFGEDNIYGNNIHHQYTRRNIYNDIKETIQKIHPDVFFYNDLDWHPDHRAVSLLVDRALGEILKQEIVYRPMVFKGFVYYLGWDGRFDYTPINLSSTKKPNRIYSCDKRFEFGNPYLKWNERIRFPVDNHLLKTKKNILFRAINQYRFSQNAKKYFFSMMNSDAVFWKKETNNWALSASVNVSSGEASFLNDFMIIDSNNIAKRKMQYDAGVWFPDSDDKNPMITFMLNESKAVNKLVFYRDIYSYGCGEIFIDINFVVDENYRTLTEKYKLKIGKYDVKGVLSLSRSIKIKAININVTGECRYGFSEIEILSEEKWKFNKLMVGNDFIYHYYVTKKCNKLPLTVYQGDKLDDYKINLIVSKNNKEYVTLKNDVLYMKSGFKKCELLLQSCNHREVWDKVIIERRAR
ncbi:PIG-L family deacetylase [Pseudobutyrivibrio sp.]|uniref:PIG-L family deacetylase n=1 Tax=Pseudobutyrivibrio sp. TaxID=2014367 RepID=UPI0025FE0C18|nr:PIG-L family deacetylase [Pseudobutyrivibrio sp.]MBR5648202.1 PIG-L family deacetylase [Pseudobutyrivibrio sp.]